jgi:ATP phosphoribosyltransferase regulatory subunit
VLSGGRYDNLIKKFGRDCPATGFSLGINMILTALERQKKLPAKPGGGCYILYTEKGRKKAYEILREHKKNGVTAELCLCGIDIEKAKVYAAQKGMDWIIVVEDETRISTIDLNEDGTGVSK